MTRTLIAAAVSLIALGSYPIAPHALAADSDQMITIQQGDIRCLLSADDVALGGGPMAVCDGVAAPWSTEKYPRQLNLAVVRGTGEMFRLAGDLPASTGGDTVLTVGQVYRANGWTVRVEALRAFVTNDVTRHGMTVSPNAAYAAWV